MQLSSHALGQKKPGQDRIPTLTLTSYAALSRFLSLPEPQFSTQKTSWSCCQATIGFGDSTFPKHWSYKDE